MCVGEHPYIPVIGVAKVEVHSLEYDQKMMNIFHVQRAGSWNGASLMTLGDTFYAWAVAHLVPHWSTNVKLTGIKLTDLSAETGAAIDHFDTYPVSGTLADTFTAPLNVTVVGKWTTDQRGRSYRGRTYFTAIPQTYIQGNKLNATGVTAYTSAMSALWSDIQAMANSLVVVSYCHNKEWRTEGVKTIITGYSVNEDLDSQRRRLNGRGQ